MYYREIKVCVTHHADFDLVAVAIASAEALGAAQTAEHTTDHDANTRAERLALLHAVRSKDQRAFLALRDDVRDDGPHEAAGDRIHAS
jgi:hypothetical protein